MNKKSKLKWIYRSLIESPYCITLCQNKKAFRQELKRLKIPKDDQPEWIAPGKDGTAHFFQKVNKVHDLCAIVCVKSSADPVQTVGLIVHEAVHCWQRIKEEIGEREPSKEFEAYSIQAVAQRLMASYQKPKRGRK